MKKFNDSIDYKKYVSIQKMRALKKWSPRLIAKHIFGVEFKSMWDRVKEMIVEPKIVGCMGIRSGAEYFEFPKYLPNAEIFGVDIAEKVVEVGKNCYCYDFNHLPKEWEGKFDLIYSNSLDHSFDIKETIQEWRRVVKKSGYILISFSSCEKVTNSDRYAFSKEDVEELFSVDQFEIVKVWDSVNTIAFYGLFKKK